MRLSLPDRRRKHTRSLGAAPRRDLCSGGFSRVSGIKGCARECHAMAYGIQADTRGKRRKESEAAPSLPSCVRGHASHRGTEASGCPGSSLACRFISPLWGDPQFLETSAIMDPSHVNPPWSATARPPSASKSRSCWAGDCDSSILSLPQTWCSVLASQPNPRRARKTVAAANCPPCAVPRFPLVCVSPPGRLQRRSAWPTIRMLVVSDPLCG